MPDVTFSFEARQVSGVANRIKAAAAAFTNRLTGRQQAAYRRAAEIYLADQGEQFDRNSAGAGDWPPLAESTVRAKGGDTRILEQTNALRESLNPGAPNNVLRVTAAGFVAGTSDPKAKFHQYGTGRIPPRRVIRPPSPAAQAAIAAAVREGVADSFRGFFRRK